MPRAVPYTLLVASILLGACGSDALTAETVSSIPEGSAVGTSQSGVYELEVQTTECSGRCGGALCEIGARGERDAVVRQADGRLQLALSTLPAQLQGGAYLDGSFEVGAFAPLEDALEVTALGRGSINELGELSSTLLVRTTGTRDGVTVDCLRVDELLGERESD